MPFFIAIASEASGEPWLLLPWDQIDWPSPLPTLGIGAGLFGLTLLLYHLDLWRRRRHARRVEWERVLHLCQSRHLTRDETIILAQAIHRAELEVPGLAVVSRSHFDRLLATHIAAKHGNAMAEILREKLFGAFAEMFSRPSSTYPDTRNIRVGKTLRLHVHGFPGHFLGPVVANTEEGLSVLFPEMKYSPLPLEPQDRVEGTFESATALVGFASEVIDVTPGAFTVCRLAHTAAIGEIHHRECIRLEQNLQVACRRIRAKDLLGQDADGGEPFVGTLTDISPGGGSIRLPADQLCRTGDHLRFDLPRPGAKPLPLSGEVLSLSTEKDGLPCAHLRFTGLDEAARQELTILLYGLKPAGRR